MVYVKHEKSIAAISSERTRSVLEDCSIILLSERKISHSIILGHLYTYYYIHTREQAYSVQYGGTVCTVRVRIVL